MTHVSRFRLVLLAVAVEGGLGVLALLLAWAVGWPLGAQVAWTWTGCGWGLAAVVPLVPMLLWLMHAPPRGLGSVRQAMVDLVVPIFRGCSLGELALVSALAGWGEELLFRGLVQGLATDGTGEPAWGIACGALAFGLAHPLSGGYVAVAALVGAYLGVLAHWSGNLLVPMTAHAAYDLAALVYLVRWYRWRGPEERGAAGEVAGGGRA